jgi:hypothetical protein
MSEDEGADGAAGCDAPARSDADVMTDDESDESSEESEGEESDGKESAEEEEPSGEQPCSGPNAALLQHVRAAARGDASFFEAQLAPVLKALGALKPLTRLRSVSRMRVEECRPPVPSSLTGAPCRGVVLCKLRDGDKDEPHAFYVDVGAEEEVFKRVVCMVLHCRPGWEMYASELNHAPLAEAYAEHVDVVTSFLKRHAKRI